MSDPTTLKGPLDLEQVEELKKSPTFETAFTGHEAVQNVVRSKEERLLVLKLDLTLVPLGSLIYFVAYLDRNSIGNARLMGLEKDLRLTPNQFYNCLVCLALFIVTTEHVLMLTSPPFRPCFSLGTSFSCCPQMSACDFHMSERLSFLAVASFSSVHSAQHWLGRKRTPRSLH
jgi:hypothetical protein